MSRELDRRDFSVARGSASRFSELSAIASEVSNRLPGDHRVMLGDLDNATGNPSRVLSEAGPTEGGNYVSRALAHVQSIGQALGLDATQPSEFVADPTVQCASSGARAVHLQQQYQGIPIFQAAETVLFSPQGTLQETTGSLVTVNQELNARPFVSATEAVSTAAAHVAEPAADEQGQQDEFGEALEFHAVDVSQFEPKVTVTFSNKPDQPTVLEPGPFAEPISANLVWFPLADDDLRLAWEVVITMPNFEGQFRTLVDAHDNEILYCRQLMHTVAARGNVYQVDGSQTRQMVAFPRSLGDYGLPVPLDLPPRFPDDWVEADGAVGNAVNAHLGQSGGTIAGADDNGVIVFDPQDPEGDDQKVLNIFYYNCYMHDYFYLLGFREEDGNFQRQNFGRGGQATDRVDARAHSGPVFGTANMATPRDGRNPVMNMGLVSRTNRHTAFDSSVVFHEFMHGVTNRLVGGPLNVSALDMPQSGGMGEGWGDYVACTINNTLVVGAWVVNNAGGIRQFSYDEDFPDNFGNLGSGRYTEVHNIGEIWCATLMTVNRRIGAQLAVQLVVDALKLSPANPSFLDMRDAILQALDNKLSAGQVTAVQHREARGGIWQAFAKFGMGPNARSNGASLSGIVADFETPDDGQPDTETIAVRSQPNLAIPDALAAGVFDSIDVDQSGRIAQMSVSVDIPHTFIGDLRVTLIAPDGRQVRLHDRSGGGTDNLVKTYTSEGIAGLADLAGEGVRGSWTLHVADLAARDTGTLREWGLEFVLEQLPGILQAEAAPAEPIPDNDPVGISSKLTLNGDGNAKNVKVSVDITHTFIGDLQVELETPSGTRVLLHNRSGFDRDNLLTTYESATNATLARLEGEPARGDWTLRVRDLAGLDVGKLNKWKLEVAV